MLSRIPRSSPTSPARSRRPTCPPAGWSPTSSPSSATGRSRVGTTLSSRVLSLTATENTSVWTKSASRCYPKMLPKAADLPLPLSFPSSPPIASYNVHPSTALTAPQHVSHILHIFLVVRIASHTSAGRNWLAGSGNATPQWRSNNLTSLLSLFPSYCS